MFAVPEDEPNEKTYSHDGEPQIDVPSVQHPCRRDRAQGGQDQQQGSPALREFLLFDHSRFSSRRREAHSASHQRFFLALSSRQLAAQVHNLTYMMIRMPRTTHENLEAIRGLRLALGSVRFSPVLRLLLSNRGHHHGDSTVKCPQRFLLRRRLVVRKLTVAIANVTRFGDACSDVIVQIARQMQDQVSNTVSVRIGFAPELFIRKRVDPLVQLRGNKFVIRRQADSHRFANF